MNVKKSEAIDSIINSLTSVACRPEDEGKQFFFDEVRERLPANGADLDPFLSWLWEQIGDAYEIGFENGSANLNVERE